ncbi:hypothetical protein DAEQUDRAFT_731694 [Daedalea quercina L-15889]|uniref:Uncharacterized protein n=1 Tax=Daedalea quercina L-15889 TaxID=1314783 RepID=A0A165M3D8_9APHY|nr:hypothetical protein DAEQUDRAFT_731694 [Daedalea quercina L-15889]
MFQSVFNRRKVQRTINQITGVRQRPQSPPSPASFVSEDVVDIHEKMRPRLLPAPPDGSLRGRPHDARDSTPRVHLELDAHRQSSYSDWFPKDLLNRDVRTPPPRDASLANIPAASAAPVDELAHENGWAPDRSFGASTASLAASTGDVIIIEPLRADTRDKALPPLVPGDADSDVHAPLELEAPHAQAMSVPIIRKPTPTPIKIPDNPAASHIHIQRSASAGASAGAHTHTHTHLPVPGAHSNGPSRPASPGSVGTDDLCSSVSGTTLARALVNSFIAPSDARASRYRSGVTRQDSATLPRGEHPFHGRYARRNSADSPEAGIPPVPPLPSSAELSARGLDSGRPADGAKRNSLVAAMENRMSSAELPYAGAGAAAPRRNSLGHAAKGDQPPPTVFSPISPITEQPSPAPSAPNTPTFNALVHGSPAGSSASPGSLSNASSVRRSTNLADAHTPAPSRAASAASSSQSDGERPQRPPATRAMSFSPGYDSGASVYSPGFDGTAADASSTPAPAPTPVRSHRAMSTGSPVGAFGNNYVSRSRSDSSVHRAGAIARPTLLPIGERPHSALVPRSPDVHTAQDGGSGGGGDGRVIIAPPLHFGPLPSGLVPVTARLPVTGTGDTPVDSPDLLDFMFPVAPSASLSLSMSTATRSGESSGRSGAPPAPLALAILDRHAAGLPTPTLSSALESGAAASANLPPFPETPYAFSPLLSAGIASPYPPMPPRGPNGSRSALPQTLSHARMGDLKMRWQQQKTILQRSATTAGRSGVASGLPTPPNSMEGAAEGGSSSSSTLGNGHQRSGSDVVVPAVAAARALPSIQESRSPSMSPSPPGSRRASQNVVAPAPVPADEVPPRPSMDSQVEDGQPTAPPPTPSDFTNTAGSPQRSLRGRSTLPPPLTPLPPVPGDEHTDPPSESPPPAYTQAESSSSATAAQMPRTGLHPDAANGVPLSRQSSVQSTATHASERSHRSSVSKARPSMSVNSSQSLPSPPASAVPLPPSPLPASPMPSINEHPIEHPPPPPYEARRTPPPSPLPPLLPSPRRAVTVSLSSAASSVAPELPQPKRSRQRPAVPLGPRKPSAQGRSRTGSVSSVVSNQVYGGPSAMRKPSMATLASASSPKFQTTPVRFRGLTKEAAEWTLSSQQLQQLVSTAIRQTADVSAIRLLPLDTFNDALPQEIARLESRSAELKTNYKLNVRRRRMLLGTLSSMADGSEPSDFSSATRISEELSEVTDSLDQITEELYDVTTQLGQLGHLRDVHSSSALIMALHKLNRSLKKHLTEGQKMREQLEALEAERDEAWRQAQEVAQDFDDLAERALEQPATGGKEITSSRRSSRVSLARKNSARRAQNGLRGGPGHRRSQRSSVSSAQLNSGTIPPSAAWSASTRDIPPVPPVPPRSTLGIVTDLPSGRTAMSSSGTPSSEFKAMTEAQKELCDMLGISLDDLKRSSRPSRRQSMSDALGSSNLLSPSRARRNSEGRIVSPRLSPELQSPAFV